MSKKSSRPPGRYHHGNLKRALVDAYIELLVSTPGEKLSLRKLAAYVGVAPTAVYNHFTDKLALIAEVKMRCLLHLTEYLAERCDSSQEPEQRIRDLGQAYYQYSIDHTQYFERIFQEEVPDEYITQDLLDALMAAEAECRSAICALLEKHQLPATQYNEGLGTFACWSLAHGITQLAAKRVNHAAGIIGRWPDEFKLHNEVSVRASFNAMAEVLIAGILSVAGKPHD